MTPARAPNDVLGKWPAWTLCGDRPALIAPSGREFALAATREKAVHVLRAVARAFAREGDWAAIRATPLPELYTIMLHSLRHQGEEIVGGTLAQLLDVAIWQLTWDDVTPEDA